MRALKLLVLAAELDDQEGRFQPPDRANEGGHSWATLTTSDKGHFRVSGLEPGHYVVRAMSEEPVGGYTVLLTTAPVPADGSVLKLVHIKSHLAVSVRDSNGQRVPPAELHRFPPGFGSRLREWPAAARVLVRAAEPGEVGLITRSRSFLSPIRRGSNPGFFEVQGGRSYLVCAVGGDFSGRAQVIDVPPDAGQVPVELRAQPNPPMGEIDVTVLSGSKVLTGEGSDLGFDLVVEDPTSRLVLMGLPIYGRAWPATFRLPVGTYSVVASGMPELDSYHGTLMEPRLLGHAQATVQVLDAQVSAVTLDLGEGAKVELTLEGKGSPADLEAALEQNPWLGGADDPAWLEVYGRTATAHLVATGRDPEPLYRRTEWEGTSAADTHLENDWPLGQTFTSEVLPTGSYTLVARLPGGREVRRTVELRAGETTKVSLRFE